ncbi:hypothetical protein IJG04_00050 [Candidatus Saccharibacteria bacterium]|nr:hypothetical protein [Candidatus Saccharibacteria bacterium]
MKKLLYGGVGVVMMGVLAGMVALSNVGAEKIDTMEPLISEPAILTNNKLLGTNDETVYVMAGADGTERSVFVGNVLYTGEEKLPFELSVRYYLDGTEVTVDEIAGKSGHVRMEYSYESTKSYQSVAVPFVAVTGMMLDDKAEFSNIKVENGRIVDDGSRVTVVGYALVGIDSLGINGMNIFAIEADVQNFKTTESYTLLTNEVFANIDTSALVDVDSVVGAINDLASGLDTIIAGASNLNNGLAVLVEKSGELVSGAEQLRDGLGELVSNNDALNGGAKKVFDSLLSQASDTINERFYEMFSPMVIAQYAQYGITPSDEQITAGITSALAEYGLEYPVVLTIDNYGTVLDGLVELLAGQGADTTELVMAKKSLDGYATFYNGVLGYTAGVSQAASGAENLATGAVTLVNGEKTLAGGANMLVEGLRTFKSVGIDKLVEVANNDIAGFTRNARALVRSANSYHYFENPSASSVKFVVKTAGV